LYTALTLNGLLHAAALNYNQEIPLAALNAGAIAAGVSGKGPAVVALTRGSTSKIKKAWKRFGFKIIEAKTNNEPACIVK
jgi:shikimate kinase